MVAVGSLYNAKCAKTPRPPRKAVAMHEIDEQSKQYLWSSYREMLLEHLFVGEILKNAWLRHLHVEVLKPQTDDAGYDIVLGCHGHYRHIQLKAKVQDATAKTVTINQALSTPDKSGCVVWFYFNPESMSLGPFYWFGDKPGKPLPDISAMPTAKHNKGDATGKKSERPNIRKLSRTKCDKIDNVADLFDLLFILIE